MKIKNNFMENILKQLKEKALKEIKEIKFFDDFEKLEKKYFGNTENLLIL